MLVIIIIFLISIISLFGIIMFRAWEIKKMGIENPIPTRKIVPEIYFRHVEKIMLYLAKYIIQWIILMAVKYWFIFHTKTKKWTIKNLPKIYKFFKKKTKNIMEQKHSFVDRAIMESKMKIRKIRENVRKEHGEVR